MASISVNDIGNAAYRVGWRGKDLAIAIAVAMAESGGRTDAVNHNSNGTTDYGVWQINSIHNPSEEEKTQLGPNARKAKSVWDDRAKTSPSGWDAWSTYLFPHKYLLFMPGATTAAAAVEALAAAGKLPEIAGAGAGAVVGGLPGAIAGFDPSNLVKIFTTLGDTYTWKRLAFFGVGVLIGVIGLVMVLRKTSIGEAVEGSVKDVAKVVPKL